MNAADFVYSIILKLRVGSHDNWKHFSSIMISTRTIENIFLIHVFPGRLKTTREAEIYLGANNQKLMKYLA